MLKEGQGGALLQGRGALLHAFTYVGITYAPIIAKVGGLVLKEGHGAFGRAGGFWKDRGPLKKSMTPI